jgi:hypothetical protein
VWLLESILRRTRFREFFGLFRSGFGQGSRRLGIAMILRDYFTK